MNVQAEIENLKQVTKSVLPTAIQETLTEIDDLYKRIYGVRNYTQIHSPHLLPLCDAFLEEAHKIEREAKKRVPVRMGSLSQSIRI